MLDINYREICILNVLLNNEYVEIEEIMQVCGTSLRTVLNEINILNDIFNSQKYDIQISNQRGKGYFLDYSIDMASWVEELKRQCSAYLNLSFNTRFDENRRVSCICRYFMTSPDFFKIEELAEKLNVSIGTIKKDMLNVRKNFKIYGLKIKTTPYHGMKLVGEEMAIRSCMVDYFGFYSFSLDSIFYQDGLKQYHISIEEAVEMRGRVLQVIRRKNYFLTDNGFTRIVLYLLVTSIRSRGTLSVSPGAESLNQTEEYGIAQELACESMSPEEISGLALFILANSETSHLTENSLLDEIAPETQALFSLVCHSLEERIQIKWTDYPELYEYLNIFFYKFVIRKKYHIFELEVPRSRRNIIRKFPSSMAFATYIYHEIPGIQKRDYYDMLFCELVMNVYNLIYTIKNKYNPTHILVINENGFAANASLISRLGLSQQNLHFHFHYFYEIEDIDFRKYDYLFISEGFHYNADSVPIPVLPFDFFMQRDVGENLFKQILFSKRQVGSVSSYLSDPIILHGEGGLSQVCHQIAVYFMNAGYAPADMSLADFESLIFTLISNADYSTHSTIKYLNLFACRKMEHKYFIFQLKQAVSIKKRKITSFRFIFLDLSKGLVEIKNGDSEIRRYIGN